MAPTVPEAEEKDEKFVPPPNLDVPVDIAIVSFECDEYWNFIVFFFW